MHQPQEHEPKTPKGDEGESGGDASPKTPCRRLFAEGDQGHGSSAREEKNMQESPQTKQAEKKPRKTRVTRGKRAKPSTPSKPGPSEGGAGSVQASPAKPKKRTRKGSKQQQDGSAEAPPVASQAEPSEPRTAPVGNVKMPSDRASKKAKDRMIEARADPATWFHVQRLWKSINGKVTKENPGLKKFEYWQFSMYYNTFRVGLLHKGTSGKLRHVLSFGGGHCTDIGLPLEAAYMYVTFMNFQFFSSSFLI